jgi:hypothetical protein
MSHDSKCPRVISLSFANKHLGNQANLTLKNDKPLLKISRSALSENSKQINELLAKATEAVEGTFLQGPFLATPDHQQMTVHPLYAPEIVIASPS